MSFLSLIAVVLTGFCLNKDAWCYVYSEKKKMFLFQFGQPQWASPG